jgi:hypothetical protein
MSEPFLVLGATGRIGQAMRRHAPLDGLDAVWQSRLPSPGYLAWDILAGRCPEGTAAGVVAMGDLLDAAGAEWTFGPKNPKVIPRVELDITCLQNLVDLPPDAGQAATIVAEWRRWRA